MVCGFLGLLFCNFGFGLLVSGFGFVRFFCFVMFACFLFLSGFGLWFGVRCVAPRCVALRCAVLCFAFAVFSFWFVVAGLSLGFWVMGLLCGVLVWDFVILGLRVCGVGLACFFCSFVFAEFAFLFGLVLWFGSLRCVALRWVVLCFVFWFLVWRLRLLVFVFVFAFFCLLFRV